MQLHIFVIRHSVHLQMAFLRRFWQSCLSIPSDFRLFVCTWRQKFLHHLADGRLENIENVNTFSQPSDLQLRFTTHVEKHHHLDPFF